MNNNYHSNWWCWRWDQHTVYLSWLLCRCQCLVQLSSPELQPNLRIQLQSHESQVTADYWPKPIVKDMFRHNFPVDREVANLLQVIAMKFGKWHDITDTTDFCLRQLVTDLLWLCYGETGVMDFGKTCYREVANLLWTCYGDFDHMSLLVFSPNHPGQLSLVIPMWVGTGCGHLEVAVRLATYRGRTFCHARPSAWYGPRVN